MTKQDIREWAGAIGVLVVFGIAAGIGTAAVQAAISAATGGAGSCGCSHCTCVIAAEPELPGRSVLVREGNQ